MWGITLLFLLLFIQNCNYSKKAIYEDTLIVQDSIESQTIKRIIDGDTFELDNGERVRLIGVDTPEKFESSKLNKDSELSNKDKETIKRLGIKSSLYADSILYGKEVLLLPDSTNSDRDRYGRLLRYVYYNDSVFFNLQIIKDGYAYAYTKYPFIYMEEFRNAEREARENMRGLWGDEDF